ncbi:S8 family peptidase [Methylobacterium brachiatum]|uniref:S8 family peptidase n=1 Tax=Methylobacterium brachiatum TaxID=269660 RepID=UPI002446A731|nr:S8 family serine peptidase [Methylobacterium brachiatum]MDH2313897.1 S8 family serine peptidase [Methylobacterium brachiatum]
MDEKIKLKYGDQTLTLARSERLIAVKSRPGMESFMERAIDGFPGTQSSDNSGRLMLGGFKVVEAGTTMAESSANLEQLRRDPAVAIGSHVYHTSDDGVPFVPTGEVYVEFKPDTSSEQKEALFDRYKLQIIEARGANALIAKTTPDSPNPVKVASELQEQSVVEFAEPDLATPGQLKSFALPADELLQAQWHLENKGVHLGQTIFIKAGADARVIAAWRDAESLGSPEVILAVIDDGFDLAHPDLSEPSAIINAWDFTRRTGKPTPDPRTEDWHGTACAGVALGRANGRGIVGAAPGVALMPVRWGPDLSDRQVEAWFAYVRDKGAWVLSCSWGAAAANFPLGRRRELAIADCARNGRGGKGCVVIFAAGNSNHDINAPETGTVDGFAIHPDVIAVAASNSRDQRSNYSNFGKEIWICAPSNGAGGWGIVTADVTGFELVGGVMKPLGYDPSDYTYEFGGTSSACPLVAGVCALILSSNPDLTATEVRTILRETARQIGDGYDEHGHSIHFGYGCVDAQAAVRRATGKGIAIAAA